MFIETGSVPFNANWFGVTYKEDKPYVMGEIQKLVDGNVYPKKLF